MKKTKYLHIILIILGIIFITIPVFHNNLWLDESYTVGIVKNSFADIWEIGSNDVHPILYYWILHLVYLIFGSNIYIYRIVSVIPLAILGILGFTHIRKDFDEKTGLLFSFFTFFLPITSVYAGEIRMYTFAMLFVSIMAIYAYRTYKNPITKNWTIFAIFSLASCYTHYYALAAAGIVNLILFIYLLKKAIKSHKQENKKLYTKELKCFTASAIVQIVLYLPWLIYFLNQVMEVSKGFWIPGVSFDLLLQIFYFQFTGNLDIMFIPQTLAGIFGIILLGYTIYSLIKAKKEKNNVAGYLAIGIYLIVFFTILIVSLIGPILYPRYFLTLTGLFIFFMAFFIAKGGRKVLTIIICLLVLTVAGIVNINETKINYDTSNQQPLEYIKKDLKETDLILFDNYSGGGFALSVQLPNNPTCFYDFLYYNKESAYKGFRKDLLYIHDFAELENYQGRIWVVSTDNYSIYNDFKKQYNDNLELIKQEIFYTKYHNYNYSITLINKK